MTAPPVLDVRRLRAEFVHRTGASAVVRDVSFSVGRGEKVAIVGESGCGKSTLALALLGLLDAPGRIAGGDVVLNGRSITALGDRALGRVRNAEIALIFQDPMAALDPVMTIGSQVVDTIRRHRPEVARSAARRRAVELLREVEVPAAERRLDDYPHQYSGGMRQRVMIAIALANDPDIVIADEPTTALDVTTQAQVLDLLDRLVGERGAAIVLITHNLGLVAAFCDRVLVMYAGRIVEQGSVDAIFARPLHPYTEALLGAIPRAADVGRDRLPSIPGLPPDPGALPAGCTFEPRCPVGRGREACVARAPVPAVFGGGSGTVMAECHLAAERIETRGAGGRAQ